MSADHIELWVCVDCYFAHHYGAHEHDGAWFAGESDTPSDREPLGRCHGLELTDDAYGADYDGTDGSGEGYDGFAMTSCDGCGSTLGGARYRMSAQPITHRAFGIAAPAPIITGWSS